MTAPRTSSSQRTLRRQLARLGFATYDDFLSSPLWAATKWRYQHDKQRPQACICGATDVQLHHRTYERLGEERTTDLYPLCPTCHQILHSLVRRGLLAADANPEVLTSSALAERYAATLAEARDRAAQQLASPTPLRLLDRMTVKKLNDRAKELRRRRTESAKTKWPRRDDHARPEDLHLRTFDPNEDAA